jgi:hypothetical protein
MTCTFLAVLVAHYVAVLPWAVLLGGPSTQAVLPRRTARSKLTSSAVSRTFSERQQSGSAWADHGQTLAL